MPISVIAARVAAYWRRLTHGHGATLLLLGPVVGATAWLEIGPVAGLCLAVLFPLIAGLRPLLETVDPQRNLVRTGPQELIAALNNNMPLAGAGLFTGAIMVEIDRFSVLAEKLDQAGLESVLIQCADRLRHVVRSGDMTARLDGPVFAVALTPTRRFGLESAIQLSTRIQRALADPLVAAGINHYLTASVGFALAQRLDSPDGERLLHAARLALIEAGRSGPGAIRSYSGAMQARVTSRGNLAEDVAQAMTNGQIMAFFQPQVSTRTGEVTGCEALARWHHPERGLIPPAEFLPALRQAGLMDRLGSHMVSQALLALRHWDDAGLAVPRVGVNFSTEDLIDPRLTDRIAWELDRFDLHADRLGIEVLETVVAERSDDIVVRNLTALARMGCRLDLDDFGTGHASITNIRRFAIGRIKIDRTFVTRIDADPEQQAMVSAILTMAERLGLDTLAEGVETAGERSMLAELGCGHVQGFGIARPMPLAETTAWLVAARARAGGPVPLRRLA